MALVSSWCVPDTQKICGARPRSELRFCCDFAVRNSARRLPRMVEAAIAPMKPVFAQLAWITPGGAGESGLHRAEPGRGDVLIRQLRLA